MSITLGSVSSLPLPFQAVDAKNLLAVRTLVSLPLGSDRQAFFQNYFNVALQLPMHRHFYSSLSLRQTPQLTRIVLWSLHEQIRSIKMPTELPKPPKGATQEKPRPRPVNFTDWASI